MPARVPGGRTVRVRYQAISGRSEPDTSQCRLYGAGIGSVNDCVPMARNPLFKDRRIRMRLGISHDARSRFV